MSDAAGDRGGDGRPEALTVSELNAAIAGVVDDSSLSGVACVGEVSDWYESGVACYFTLTDSDGELECTLWQSRYRSIDCDVEDGDEVFVRGDVGYYGDWGKLSLYPTDVRVLGDGDRLARVEALRRDLRERGWLDEAAKGPLPRFPNRVGIVTSRNGDARHDFQQAIHERHPGIDLVLQHSGVQGDDAPDELKTGVAALDGEVDIVLLGRGGGSDTDLAAFDTETVATAVFSCETPIVTAVGHEKDVSIADEVADASAITPTAAGSLAAPDRDAETDRFETFERDLTGAFVANRDDRLEALSSRLAGAFEGLVEGRTAALSTRLEAAGTDHATRRLADLNRWLETAAGTHLDREHARAATDLENAADRLFERRLSRLGDRLEAAHRGFEREAELERERSRMVEEARDEVPLVYKAAILLLVLTVVALIALLLLGP